jgi:hypothetical protein
MRPQVSVPVFRVMTKKEAAYQKACLIHRRSGPLRLAKTPGKQPERRGPSPLKAPDHTPSTSDCGQEHATMESGVFPCF